ncbi:MAG: polyphosphate kinase 1 [Bacteroidales bacterium]|nr:polyphosphate kinase 1 [Bacteroidales bacterium]
MTKDSSIYINREISWLHFNARVLQEAIDETTPLIERIKFLGIFSNNRDEFFRVRVATLNRMININNLDYKVKYDPKKILKEINEIVTKQEKIFTKTYFNIVKAFAKKNIHIINEKQLNEEHGKFVKKYFHENLRAYLFPIMLENFHRLTSLKDKSIYLAIELISTKNELIEKYALIKVPTSLLSRFLILPQIGDEKYIILLDDVIRYCLKDIFSIFGYDTFNAYTIKLTRDAEMDIDNDVSKSFIEIMSESIKQRKKGIPVRFVYDETIPDKFLKILTKKLKISEKDNLRKGDRYHNFKDFMSFPQIGTDQLVYPPFPPLPHKDLSLNKSIIEVIKQKDIMLHFPYQSFQYIIDLLCEASIDPKVTSIKMTFYRAAKYSNVINALVNAARNGKSVTVFLELQARFDEEANIILTGKLQDEGVKIIQTIPGFKVHSKLILITRKENNENVFYANISTGNFNESTAKVYADDSLLTANKNITEDVDKVFHLFETRYTPPTFKSLIVSPFDTRNFFIRMLNNEIDNSKAGKNAWAIIKLNSLVDKKIIRKLYQASQAGVKIKIIVRGICVLIPGIPGLSENIEAFGIVDKFLEHSRVYIFCNNDDEKYYFASADWMQRNFDHRIEVTCPVYDKDIQKELMKMLKIQLNDNTKARIISKNNPNQYRKTNSKTKVRSQFEIYKYFQTLLE